MPLQRQAEPTQMGFAAQILKPERQPDVRAGGDRPAQRLHDRVDLGEVVVSCLALAEGEGLRDDRAAFGRLCRQHVQPLRRVDIPKT